MNKDISSTGNSFYLRTSKVGTELKVNVPLGNDLKVKFKKIITY